LDQIPHGSLSSLAVAGVVDAFGSLVLFHASAEIAFVRSDFFHLFVVYHLSVVL
jgi:hypothetical protein